MAHGRVARAHGLVKHESELELIHVEADTPKRRLGLVRSEARRLARVGRADLDKLVVVRVAERRRVHREEGVGDRCREKPAVVAVVAADELDFLEVLFRELYDEDVHARRRRVRIEREGRIDRERVRELVARVSVEIVRVASTEPTRVRPVGLNDEPLMCSEKSIVGSPWSMSSTKSISVGPNASASSPPMPTPAASFSGSAMSLTAPAASRRNVRPCWPIPASPSCWLSYAESEARCRGRSSRAPSSRTSRSP